MPILHCDTIAVMEAITMKILLAEDDINLGKLLSMLLKKQNITVNWVQDGEAAYDAVYADGYDVLVLDWMMPLLSGLDLCKRLREEEYQGKILLLTAKDTLADKLLELLLRNRGQVMPRAVLQDRIWGIDSDVTENNLDVHIRLLRKKIMELNGEELIKTMRGVGYYVE